MLGEKLIFRVRGVLKVLVVELHNNSFSSCRSRGSSGRE